SSRAALHLPLGTFAHKDGTVVSLEWRAQKRTSAALVNVAPDLLEVFNGIAVAMGAQPLAGSVFELNAELRAALPLCAQEQLESFPHHGVLLHPKLSDQAAPQPPADTPEFKGNAEFPLVVVPKRFLYNDRE